MNSMIGFWDEHHFRCPRPGGYSEGITSVIVTASAVGCMDEAQQFYRSD
jgi:hypothetical protein